MARVEELRRKRGKGSGVELRPNRAEQASADRLRTRRYWPFLIPVAAKETEETKRQVAFLEKAKHQGHKSFDQGSLIGAVASSGREGEMIPRSGVDRGLRRYGEVILSHKFITDDSFYIDGFENAAEAVLLWLQGEETSQIRSCKEKWIVQRPGLRSEVART
jgi:hypothetical protein